MSISIIILLFMSVVAIGCSSYAIYCGIVAYRLMKELDREKEEWE